MIAKIRIDEINFGSRHRTEYGDIDGLAKSIKAVGLLNPVTVAKINGGYRLLAGGRRVRACRQNGESMILASVVECDDELTGLLIERDENEHRKELSVSERVALGKAVEKLLGNRHGGDRSKVDRGPPCSKIPGKSDVFKVDLSQTCSGKTRDIAAEAAGFESGRQYDRAKKVVDNAVPEVVEAVDAGEVSVKDAAAVADKTAEKQKAALKQKKAGKARTLKEVATKGDSDEGELEKIVDAAGVDVPKDAIQAFQAAKDMTAWCRKVDALIHEAEALANGPGGRCVRIEALRQSLKDAKGNIWANRPTNVCPYCDGHGGKCKACNGDGWVPKHIFEAAPKKAS